ncbi:MAG: ornithine cyclodeaminase family protein [Actinobacteria bacterium]|nr:ornithine cyclodeaminase family protein [Actinomycetota bacterium]
MKFVSAPLYLGPEELSAALPLGAAIDALDEMFSGQLPSAPRRSHHDVGPGELLIMPAWSAGRGAGVKLVTVSPDNPGRGLPLVHGMYVLFEPESLAIQGLIDGAALTTLRTAAVSGVATKHLARPDSSTLVVFGGGIQGLAHLEAMVTVLPQLEQVLCVSRSVESSQRLVSRAKALGLRGVLADPTAVASADVVCTCTTSATPLFDGSLLSPGTHVNAIGAYKPNARELDDAAMRRAMIFVELKASALHEAGDLRLPIEAGLLKASDITELADVASARTAGRSGVDDITIFKSVGVAFEDLVVATAAVKRARAS